MDNSVISMVDMGFYVGIILWALLRFFIQGPYSFGLPKILTVAQLTKVILTCLQGIFGCVPWAVIGTFLADFLATNAEMGVPGATTVLFSFGIGSQGAQSTEVWAGQSHSLERFWMWHAYARMYAYTCTYICIYIYIYK